LLPHLLLGALSWDPQIRGMLIVIAAIAILPGSVYLLLATNVGARLGFLLAVAGLSGWLMLLGITWAFYGQGIKGRDPSWKVREVIHTRARNDLSAGTLTALRGFPAKGWEELPLTGSAMLGDAQAAADNFITKSGRKPKIGPEGPIVKDPTPEMQRFPAEFSESSDYVVIDGYTKGGDNCLGGETTSGLTCKNQFPKFIRDRVQHDFYFRHSAHYVAVELRPVVPQVPGPDGVPPKPIADFTKPITTVVVERDLGSIRFPQVMMAIASGIVFAVTCHALHRRDKQLMAIRAAGGPTPVTA
jgi:hypothetical protein